MVPSLCRTNYRDEFLAWRDRRSGAGGGCGIARWGIRGTRLPPATAPSHLLTEPPPSFPLSCEHYYTVSYSRALTPLLLRFGRRCILTPDLKLPWRVGSLTGQGMATPIDLRVHIAAPSSRKDDERFRAQATAYSSFVASSKHVIHASDGQPPDHGGLLSPIQHGPAHTETKSGRQPLPASEHHHITEMQYDSMTFLEDTQLGYTALESQIFIPTFGGPTSSHKRPSNGASNCESGLEKRVSNEDEIIEPRQDDSLSTHRLASQSSYLKSPVLDRSAKKIRLSEDNRRLFKAGPRVLLPHPPVEASQDLNALLPSKGIGANNLANGSQRRSSNLADHSMSDDDVTSELPTSYSLSDMASGSSRSKQESIQRSVSDPGPSALGPSNPGEGEEQVLSPRPQILRESKNPNGSPTPKQSAPAPAPPQASDSETAAIDFASPSLTREGVTSSNPRPPEDFDLPTIIRGPPPQASLQPFVTHLTESLKYLGDRSDLTQCYKPVLEVRELRTSERGCWCFNLRPWPTQLRRDFFDFLAKMIEAGRAGWGTWCMREPCSLAVQVFCWGEAVRHIYLMLYAASRSKVRKLGLQWVDAEGEVVVQMRGTLENSRTVKQ